VALRSHPNLKYHSALTIIHLEKDDEGPAVEKIENIKV
jgi:hypothetical protein